MVGLYQRSLKDPLVAARNLCALRGIPNPSTEQMAGAALESDFMLTVIHFFKGKGE